MISTNLTVTLGSYSILSIIIRLWTKRQSDRGFITWQGKTFFMSPKRADRPCGQPSFLFGR